MPTPFTSLAGALGEWRITQRWETALQFFEKYDYDPGLFRNCAKACLAQAPDQRSLIIPASFGLDVVGTSLVLEGPGMNRRKSTPIYHSPYTYMITKRIDATLGNRRKTVHD